MASVEQTTPLQRAASAKVTRCSEVLTLQQMYATIDFNVNLPWETINYQVPRRYFDIESHKRGAQPKIVTRSSYLDDIEQLGRQIPGVGHYSVASLQRKSFSRYDGKAQKRETLFVEAYNKGKRCPTPGPGLYNIQEPSAKPKLNRRNHSAVTRTSYLSEVEYLADTSPGIGQYNLSQNIMKPSFRHNKSPSYKDGTEKPKATKMSDISPIIEGTFDKMFRKCSGKPQVQKKGTFSQAKRFKVDKSMLLSTGPNKYSSKGVQTGLRRERSVYY